MSRTKITKPLILMSLSLMISVNILAGDFSDLDNDCFAFNLGASCRPKPVKPKPIKKKPIVPPKITNNEIVLLYPAGNEAEANKIVDKYGFKALEKTTLSSVKTSMLVANTGRKDPKQLSKAINKAEKNIEATANNIFSLSAALVTPARKNSANYSMNETGVSFVHKTTKGKGVKICMVDTPIDIYHSSFSNASIDTLDYTDYTPNKTASLLHGTLVAGVIVSQNKHIGIAPKANLLSIGAFSYSKKAPYRLQGSSSNIAKAINTCILYKADIINLSFTGGKDTLLEKMVNKALDKGIIVVAAAGNGGYWGSSVYPALIPGVITTTATDKNKHLYKMANKGLFVDIAAPGVNVLTVAPGDRYELASGTSISTAHVSGIIALLLSQNKQKLISEVLTETAIDLGKPGRDQEFGDGLISANHALNIIKSGRAKSSVTH